MDKIKILVATHKKVDLASFGDCYTLIQVGAAIKDKLPYLHDDVGVNISEMNPKYCELTALYWGWKNICAEYKGLCHYRRYLAKNYFSMNSSMNVYNKKELLKLFEKYELLLAKPKYRDINNSWYPTEKGLERDRAYSFIKSAIEQICPDYIDSLKYVFVQKKMFFCNVMISKSEIYDEYCEWLFKILFKVDELLEVAGGVLPRELGFYSEWLLNVWVSKNKKRFSIAYFPLARVDRKKNIQQFMLYLLEKIHLLYLCETVKYNLIYLKARKGKYEEV